MDSLQIKEEFYITLLSDSSMNYYPENSLSSFTNRMNKYFSEDWRVGVTEIYTNDFVPNVYGEHWEESTQIFIEGMQKSVVEIGTTYIPFRKNQVICDCNVFLLLTQIQNIRPLQENTRKQVERQ
jgi:hypothetical protein